MSKIKKILHLSLSGALLITMISLCIYPFIHTETVSGKLLLVEKVGSFSDECVVKFRSDDGKFLTLYLKEDDLFFDSEPEKVMITEDRKTREVSLKKLLNVIENIDETRGGISTKISYNPNNIKKFWFIKRNDGAIEEITCTLTDIKKQNQEILQISEESRTSSKPYKIKYSYSVKGNPTDKWFWVNGDTGEVKQYLKQGDRFITEENYGFSNKTVVKFKEELISPVSCLINFRENPRGNFEVGFPNKNKMIENSYYIEEQIKAVLNNKN
ncbi:hypothetical protein JCM14036_30670 [Desulfotomaculum defluvii]